MAEGDGLENRLARKGHGGSNPSSSVDGDCNRSVALIAIAIPMQIIPQVEVAGTVVVQESPAIGTPNPSKETDPPKHEGPPAVVA